MVDLERHVVEIEPLLEQSLEAAARVVAVRARRHEHVRGQRREAARHRPDVEVVHPDDVGVERKRARDVVRFDARRRAARATRRSRPP